MVNFADLVALMRPAPRKLCARCGRATEFYAAHHANCPKCSRETIESRKAERKARYKARSLGRKRTNVLRRNGRAKC